MLSPPRKYATQGQGGHDILHEDGDGDKSNAEDSAEVTIPRDVIEQQSFPSFAHVVFPRKMGNAGAEWA